ncbi:MAG TPA: hypothetical protein VIK03_10305 [Thermoleophilia bacterium]
MNRYIATVSLVIAVMLGAVFGSGCGKQHAQAAASDLTAGHRAELVTVGGARLDPKREQQVTFRVNVGQLRVIAEVTGAPADLACKLSRAQGDGNAAHWQAVAVKSSSRPAAHGTVFVLSSSSPLEPGTYRLTYTGHGWLKFLGIGANY